MNPNNKILMIETKGDDLGNDDSKEKEKIGPKLDTLTDRQNHYFMIF